MNEIYVGKIRNFVSTVLQALDHNVDTVQGGDEWLLIYKWKFWNVCRLRTWAVMYTEAQNAAKKVSLSISIV
jgi:hypothetical protein